MSDHPGNYDDILLFYLAKEKLPRVAQQFELAKTVLVNTKPRSPLFKEASHCCASLLLAYGDTDDDICQASKDAVKQEQRQAWQFWKAKDVPPRDEVKNFIYDIAIGACLGVAKYNHCTLK